MNHGRQARIAVAGADAIGKAHIAAVAGNTGCVLSAIVDPSRAADDVARPLGSVLC